VKIALAFAMLRPSSWEDVAVLSDRLGYESLWLPEHLVFPVTSSGSPNHGEEHPPVPSDVPILEPFSELAYLAAKTEQIHLGTYVYNLGLRHPFVSARGAATVDILSNGRLEFGIGASWLKEEWDAIGLDFSTRGKRVDEAIEVCQRLWRDREIEFHGEFFNFDPVMFEPKPVQQPGPPLHIGGDGAAALRRAALVGKGWIPMNHEPEELPAAIKKIAELRERSGIEGTCEITTTAAEPTLECLEKLAALGVHRAIVKPWTSGRYALEGIEEFAATTLAAANELETVNP
jgi:probable F420-dependent oxidoreductase